MIIGQDKLETVLSGILHTCLKIIETETSVYLSFHTCHTHTHPHTLTRISLVNVNIIGVVSKESTC